MSKDVSYIEDILRELKTKNPDFTEKELSEIVFLNLDYIKKKTKEKDVVHIKIPTFASFYFNMCLATKQRSIIERYNKKENFDILLNKLNKIEEINEKNIYKCKPYLRKHSYHFKPTFISNIFTYYQKKGFKFKKLKEVWEKITKKQNEN